MDDFNDLNSYVEECLGGPIWQLRVLPNADMIIDVTDLQGLTTLFRSAQTKGSITNLQRQLLTREIKYNEWISRFNIMQLVYTGPAIVTGLTTGISRGSLDIYPINIEPEFLPRIIRRLGGPDVTAELIPSPHRPMVTISEGSYLNDGQINIHSGLYPTIRAVLLMDNVGMGIGIYGDRIYASVRCIYQLVNRVIMLNPDNYYNRYMNQVGEYIQSGFSVFYDPKNGGGPITELRPKDNHRSALGRLYAIVQALDQGAVWKMRHHNDETYIRLVSRNMDTLSRFIEANYSNDHRMIVNPPPSQWLIMSDIRQDIEVCNRDVIDDRAIDLLTRSLIGLYEIM